MKRLPPVPLLVAPAALAAVIVALVVLLGQHGDPHGNSESPAGSVRRFLTAADGGNGDIACGYLSTPEVTAVEQAAGPHVPCSEAFFGAQLDIGRHDDVADIARVHFSTSWNGDSARVVASDGNSSIQFTVAPATTTAIDQQSYQPPASNWRITSGATALVRSVP